MKTNVLTLRRKTNNRFRGIQLIETDYAEHTCTEVGCNQNHAVLTLFSKLIERANPSAGRKCRDSHTLSGVATVTNS